jgi:hypothetical protein
MFSSAYAFRVVRTLRTRRRSVNRSRGAPCTPPPAAFGRARADEPPHAGFDGSAGTGVAAEGPVLQIHESLLGEAPEAFARGLDLSRLRCGLPRGRRRRLPRSWRSELEHLYARRRQWLAFARAFGGGATRGAPRGARPLLLCQDGVGSEHAEAAPDSERALHLLDELDFLHPLQCCGWAAKLGDHEGGGRAEQPEQHECDAYQAAVPKLLEDRRGPLLPGGCGARTPADLPLRTRCAAGWNSWLRG